MPSFHPRTERLMALVGPHIRAWRVAQDLTATEVADRADISRPTLRAIESDPTNVSFGNVLAARWRPSSCSTPSSGCCRG